MATIIGPQSLKPVSYIWSSLEELDLDLEAAIIAAMDREEDEGHQTRTIVPISMIENMVVRDGGIDIDCGKAGQYRLGKDGYIY